MGERIKIGIIGATGYTGYELIKLLSRHKFAEIISITSDSSAGTRISDIYPHLRRICDLTLEPNDYNLIADKIDVAFLCLPHGAAFEACKYFYEKKKVVIDLSADFRVKDKQLYEKTYNIMHTADNLLKEAVYGIPEIFKKEIKDAKIVANPGCYPTSIIVPLYPLIQEDLIDTSFIVADAKSGVSGAGKAPSSKTHFCEVNEDFKPYNIFAHRHNVEIDFILSSIKQNINVTFTPHLLPINRGIESCIYFKKKSAANLKEVLKNFYEGCFFIRVKEKDEIPCIKDVANTNFIDINVFENKDKVVIVSCIDNLIKGASGQAVQNMNIIFDINECEGLL